MYGTLSFDKGDKRSCTEFHAFSPAHGRWQRQPACDECRMARSKCREKHNKDKCARCYSTNRACTYNSAKRRPRQPQRTTETTKATPLPTGTGKDTEDEEGQGTGSPPASSAQSKTLQGQQASPNDILDFGLEAFDIAFNPGADTLVSSEARQNNDCDTDCASSFANDDEELYIPDLDSASTAVEQNDLDNYDFSALCDDSLSQIFLPTLQSSPAPTLNGDLLNGHAEHQEPLNLSLDALLGHAAPPKHGNGAQDNAIPRTSTMAGFSNLMDVMQFAKGSPMPGPATPSLDPCTCLQDLAANLFSLQRRGRNIQVDQFLLLFKQSMGRWRTVEACASACCVSQSLGLLMVMNVQQLVTLLTEAVSSLSNTGDSESSSEAKTSILPINLGSFAVEDKADQRFIAQTLLAARMKELYSFLVKVSSKMKIAGLDNMCTEYQHQIELLRRIFTS